MLEVIYLILDEGYSATAGDDLLRPALCEDALRLARVLEGLMPKETEVHRLAALLEFQASRMAARTGPDGEPVLLADQNRARWNQMFIRRGIEALKWPVIGPTGPGRHRRLPRPGRDLRRHRLDHHRRPLRPAHGPYTRGRWWSNEPWPFRGPRDRPPA